MEVLVLNGLFPLVPDLSGDGENDTELVMASSHTKHLAVPYSLNTVG